MIVERLITQNNVVYFTTNLQKEIIQEATKQLQKVIQTILELYTEPKRETVINSKPTKHYSETIRNQLKLPKARKFYSEIFSTNFALTLLKYRT